MIKEDVEALVETGKVETEWKSQHLQSRVEETVVFASVEETHTAVCVVSHFYNFLLQRRLTVTPLRRQELPCHLPKSHLAIDE